MKKLYGLIGFPLGHSFSKRFFQTKFRDQNIRARYENFPLPTLTKDIFNGLWKNPYLVGLNVTIPYKQSVVSLLDEVDDKAQQIGAVNTIKRMDSGYLKGFNTDYIGFKRSLLPFIDHQNLKALILGTGGASRAVAIVLRDLKLDYRLVSRKTQDVNLLSYKSITAERLSRYRLIINTTPLGMSPNISTLPPLPYRALTSNHFLYDLVYNPEQTAFLKQGVKYRAETKNGSDMLVEQAEAAWNIWNGIRSRGVNPRS